MSGATAWAVWHLAAVTSVPPSLPSPRVKLPSSARAGRVNGQTSLVRRHCHRCWCRCGCDWSGCRWCVKVRAKSHGRPRGKELQNKSCASASRRLDFPLEGKSEAENRSPVRIHGRDAGRAALPGPFTSVLKKQRGGGRKKKSASSVCSVLWMIKRIRSANCIRAISGNIYKPRQVWRIISEEFPHNTSKDFFYYLPLRGFHLLAVMTWSAHR